MEKPAGSGEPVLLDGSEGEGGGQILRSALAASLITGRAFRIERIRANRQPSGLRPQHLACVRGAEAISSSRSSGASLGSAELSFWPGPVRPGKYLLEVGTAGSGPLLVQCLYFPLAIAEGQWRAARSALREKGISCTAENLPLPSAPSAGSIVFVRAEFENSIAGFTALGERGRPAEAVGQDAARQVAEFMESGGAVDPYLGDQLLWPASLMAAGLLGGSNGDSTEFTAAQATLHLTTNASVLQRFLPVRIDVDPAGAVKVSPTAPASQD